MKCPSCQTVFTVDDQSRSTPRQAVQRPAAAGQSKVAQAGSAAAKGGLAPLSGSPRLFPDQSAAGKADPLANHVVQDPGFATVDIEQIRKRREMESKKDVIEDPLNKFQEEERQKRLAKREKEKQTKAGAKMGLVAAVIYVLLLIVGSIVALNLEVGFYVLLGTFVFGALLLFLTDMMLIQHIKEDDPDKYLSYAFIPPYKVYYWIVKWDKLMVFAITEIMVFLPLIANGFLCFYFDDKYGLNFFPEW